MHNIIPILFPAKTCFTPRPVLILVLYLLTLCLHSKFLASLQEECTSPTHCFWASHIIVFSQGHANAYDIEHVCAIMINVIEWLDYALPPVPILECLLAFCYPNKTRRLIELR